MEGVGKSPPYVLGQNDPRARLRKWGHWDLNPDQRVSTRQGATLSESYGSTLQSIITGQQTRYLSFPYNWSPRVYRVSPYPHSSDLYLAHLLLPLAAPHLLLAPLPSLLASLFPSA